MLTRYHHLTDFELVHLAQLIAVSNDVAELRDCVVELAQRLESSYATTLRLRYGQASLPTQTEGTA